MSPESFLRRADITPGIVFFPSDTETSAILSDHYDFYPFVEDWTVGIPHQSYIAGLASFLVNPSEVTVGMTVKTYGKPGTISLNGHRVLDLPTYMYLAKNPNRISLCLAMLGYQIELGTNGYSWGAQPAPNPAMNMLNAACRASCTTFDASSKVDRAEYLTKLLKCIKLPANDPMYPLLSGYASPHDHLVDLAVGILLNMAGLRNPTGFLTSTGTFYAILLLEVAKLTHDKVEQPGDVLYNNAKDLFQLGGIIT